MSITTHVLDVSEGRPAKGVAVSLEVRNDDGSFSSAAKGVTDADGRLRTLLPPEATLVAGTWRLTFETGAYFKTLGVDYLYPQVQVVFVVKPPVSHYHIPLLLSPFGYTTYRGS